MLELVYSLASEMPPAVMAKEASLSGISGLQHTCTKSLENADHASLCKGGDTVLKVGDKSVSVANTNFVRPPHFLTSGGCNLGPVQLQIMDFLSSIMPYKFNVLEVVSFCLLNDVMLTLPQ